MMRSRSIAICARNITERQSYDFGEETLLTSAQQVVRVKPASSIPLLRLNLELYPKSVRSNIPQIAFAYTRSLDDEAAITTAEGAGDRTGQRDDQGAVGTVEELPAQEVGRIYN